MAAAKKKGIRKTTKSRVSDVLGPPTDRLLMIELLKEMHHIVLDTGAELGASESDGRRALALAGEDKTRRRPSVNADQPSYGLAGLLARWRFDKRYLRPDGSPRALAIRGKGATFETLARVFAPNLPVAEVVDMICENAEVTRLKGNKIALLGSPVMMSPKTPEVMVASLITRFRRLAETVVYNAAIPAQIKGTGRFERIVTGVLSEKAFLKFSQSVRQQMQALADQVDAGLTQPEPRRHGKGGKTCGVGLYVFRDDGDIG
jgi:hypothetical protein